QRFQFRLRSGDEIPERVIAVVAAVLEELVVRNVVEPDVLPVIRRLIETSSHLERSSESAMRHPLPAAYTNFWRESGSSRTRLPVAAKIAFPRAARTGGSPGSPTPVGNASLCTRWTFTWRGASFIRATWKLLK